jgi:hypothetical protein
MPCPTALEPVLDHIAVDAEDALIAALKWIVGSGMQ